MSDEAAAAAAPTNAAPPADQGQAGGATEAPEAPSAPLVWDPELKDFVHVGKVDGQEKRIPWSQLQRDAQLVASAQKRFEEAKAIKHENASLREQQRMLADALINPERAMHAWQQAGLDPRAMLAHMQRTLEAEAALTPEQRELRETRAKLAAYEAQQRELAERQRIEQEEVAERAEQERYESAFAKHMDRLQIPKDSQIRGHMNTLLWGMHDLASERGEIMRLSDATAQAWGSMQAMARDVIAMMTPQERAKLLGADVVTSIATASIDRAAPIPKTVAAPPRGNDGRFIPPHRAFTTFRPGSQASFTRAANRALERG
jgi:hypothetical protein